MRVPNAAAIPNELPTALHQRIVSSLEDRRRRTRPSSSKTATIRRPPTARRRAAAKARSAWSRSGRPRPSWRRTCGC